MRDTVVEWLAPWQPVLDGEKFVAELHRELCPEHPIYGRRVELLGRRGDRDDFLFHLPDGPLPFAIVHLTWSVETAAEFPWTTFFAGVREVQERIRQDNELRLDPAGGLS